jgi:hypothetical protein
VGSNGILECKILFENAHRTVVAVVVVSVPVLEDIVLVVVTVDVNVVVVAVVEVIVAVEVVVVVVAASAQQRILAAATAGALHSTVAGPINASFDGAMMYPSSPYPLSTSHPVLVHIGTFSVAA